MTIKTTMHVPRRLSNPSEVNMLLQGRKVAYVSNNAIQH